MRLVATGTVRASRTAPAIEPSQQRSTIPAIVPPQQWSTGPAIPQLRGKTIYCHASRQPSISYDLHIFYDLVDAMRWKTRTKGHPVFCCERVLSLCQLSLYFTSSTQSTVLPIQHLMTNVTAILMLRYTWLCILLFCVETTCLCASWCWLPLVGDRASFPVLSVS